MFTGIVRDIGAIRSVERSGDDITFRIQTALPPECYTLGASVLCSGICLTVTDFDETSFSVDVSPETVSKTNIGQWQEGTEINLESSLRLGDELGGHLVFGHVDAQAELKSVEEDGDCWRMTFEVPEELEMFFAPKGSVSLDGISLTVNEVQGNKFGVCIIPHTWENTTLSERKVGNKLNLEIDMLARYVSRMLEGRAV